MPQAKHGVFNKSVVMSVKPRVKVADTLVSSPELSTITGLDDQHFGFNFWISRGGVGVVFDFLFFIQATFRFVRFDGY